MKENVTLRNNNNCEFKPYYDCNQKKTEKYQQQQNITNQNQWMESAI